MKSCIPTRRLSALAALMMLVLGALMPPSVSAFSVVRTATTLSTRSLIRQESSIVCLEETVWSSKHYPCHRTRRSTTPLSSSTKDDPLFDGRTTISLIAGQSVLIIAALVAALLLKTPNVGFGPNISFSKSALVQGTQCAIPLFIFAYALDMIEDSVPALQDVTKATQRSVLALLGGTLKPLLATVASLALGIVAGFGEELLFRGVLQYELSLRFGSLVGLSVSSIVFGLLHAVTPLYAVLATLASVFFGSLYAWTGNLAIPIMTHAVYDVGALLWAHWTVTQMTPEERDEIASWKGPSKKNET